MYLQKSTLLKEKQISNLRKSGPNGLDIDTGKSLTQKDARSMLAMCYQLVPDRYVPDNEEGKWKCGAWKFQYAG